MPGVLLLLIPVFYFCVILLRLWSSDAIMSQLPVTCPHGSQNLREFCETVKVMAAFHDEIEIEDMEYDEETETYYYPCPCGDRFQITKVIFNSVGETNALTQFWLCFG